MAHEESIFKVNESNQDIVPDTPHILDIQVQDFLEIYDYLSKVLSASDLISDILKILDSEE
ncbi:MAG: hypothetical protein KGD73_07330 [Candidatus Lokiarchaeota archaeon]|nr:hypothetical protein [Candidatus Lokiarchaeota archaeon]